MIVAASDSNQVGCRGSVVKTTTTQSVWCSVKETNWRAELETFGKGVANDSQEAQDIVHRGLNSLESLPRQATAHLPAGLGVGLEGFGEQMSGGVDPTLVQQRINKVCNLLVILAFLPLL